MFDPGQAVDGRTVKDASFGIAVPDTSAPSRGGRMDGGRQGSVELHSIVHVNEKGGSFGGTEEYVDALTVALARGACRPT